jgi:hypothetical protein
MLSIWQHDVTLQTFADHPGAERYPEIRHGTLQSLTAWAVERNQAGYGIYVTVNRTDGRGRKAENIAGLRTWYTDIDGLPTDEQKHAKVYDVLRGPLPPSAIIKTRNGIHCYYFAEPNQEVSNEAFKRTVKGVARYYGGDEGVCDISRVLRLPGYFHQKDPAEPYLVEVIWRDEGIMYREADLRAAYPPPEERIVNPAARVIISGAEDDWGKVQEALAAWPAPDGEKHRVLMVALGVALKFSVPEARAVADLIPIVATWNTRQDPAQSVRNRARWAFQHGQPCTVAALRNLGVDVPKLSRPPEAA